MSSLFEGCTRGVEDETVEVVSDTCPGSTTRAVRKGSLMEGLWRSTLKQDGHGGLRGSGYRSVIPYVHEEDYCIAVYGVVQALS
jgi:hypothetical protein